MNRIFVSLLLSLFLLGGALSAQSGNLNIYWIDVEGGGSTLIVSPTGESLLVDTGNPAPDDRDAKRIYQATQQGRNRFVVFGADPRRT
jgi:competence protein ComEC